MGLDERALAGLARRIHSGDLVGSAAFDAVVAMISADEIPRDSPPAHAARIRDEVVLGLSHDQELVKLLYGGAAPQTGALPAAKPRVHPPTQPRPQESTEDDHDLPRLAEAPEPRARGRKQKASAQAPPKRKPKQKRAAPAVEMDDFSGARRRSQLLGVLGLGGVVGLGVGFWYLTETGPCDALVKQLCLEGSTVTCEAKQFEDALAAKAVDDAKCALTLTAIEEATLGVGNEARGRVLAATLQAELGFDPRGDAAPPATETAAEKGPPKPVPLAGEQGVVTSMFVDDSHLYWTRTQSPAAMRVRNIGGTPEVLGATADPVDIKASRDYVYWLSRAPEQNTVWVDSKRGVHEPSTLPTPEFQPTRAAFIGAEFGFIDATGAIVVAAVSGEAPRKVVEPSVPAPISIAGDRTMIFFGVPAPTAAIHAVARDGSAPATALVTGVANPVVVKDHADHLYWIDGATGTIGRVPVAGGEAVALAQGQTGATSLAFDKTLLYWTDSVQGTVSSVPLGGGEITPVATGYAGVNNVAVDGAAVYWDAAGTIFRVPK